MPLEPRLLNSLTQMSPPEAAAFLLKNTRGARRNAEVIAWEAFEHVRGQKDAMSHCARIAGCIADETEVPGWDQPTSGR